MDVNKFFKDVFEDSLGLDVMGLESRFTDLVKLIERKTLLTFSSMIPVKYGIILDLTNPDTLIRKEYSQYGTEYYLSDPVLDKFDLPILGIDSINYMSNGPLDPYDPESSAYQSSAIASKQNLTIESVLMGSEYTYNRTLVDFGMPWKRYHEFRGGRVLYMKNWMYQGQVEVVINTQFPNIISIPEEYRESLIKLAKLDIKVKLWNELKYLPSIVTPAGNIELRIDDWESAERDREEFLKDLKTQSFPDRIGSHYFRII